MRTVLCVAAALLLVHFKIEIPSLALFGLGIGSFLAGCQDFGEAFGRLRGKSS